MMGVLARLGDFRGLSRFTTWAYKFALLEAAAKARRMAWRDRELPRPPEDWVAMADPDGRPEAAAEHAELDRYVELELAGQDPDVQLCPGSAPTWPAAWPAGRSTRASAPCWPPRGTDRRPLVERSRT